jgi:hypothetical protein
MQLGKISENIERWKYVGKKVRNKNKMECRAVEMGTMENDKTYGKGTV